MKLLSQRLLGPVTLVLLALTFWLGLWVTPPDKVQGNLARLLYVHPAIAWVALYLSFGTATIASALYLWKRSRSLVMDRVAHCAVEVSLVFIILTLITGSLWGRPTWGVWWAWDARLTSTAILGVFAVGYLAIRRANDDVEQRARRSAVVAILAAINVPIIHFSVQWWKTLHQGASVFTPGGNFKVHGIMLTTLFISLAAFTLLFFWLLRARYRVEVVRDERQRVSLDEALAQRRREGVH
ncbi:MAG TPA: cytochrome c biogenesis protein CcsA [Acidimicrobiales bacterium]|nr:cytochrome c biogenesis protein CcsA [Acidimicrobiales bacterium]